MTVIEKIKSQIADHSVILYMKGDAEFPQCGFSARAVQALKMVGVSFATVDVLANPDIRQELPKYSNWPTFPQLFVRGELVGGCDIISEMLQNGELEALLKSTTTE